MKRMLMGLVAAVAAAPLVLWAQAKPKPGAVESDWYQFRGPKRDGLSPDTGLLKQWPAAGPTLAWKATGLGEGFSSVVVAGKAVYTMGTLKGSSALIALNAADGKMVWAAGIPDKGGSNGAGPRSTPATDGALVFGLGQEGTLFCVQAATGKEVWRKSMSSFGGKMMSGWGYSESPLLDGQALVVTPGGSNTVVALLKTSGAPAWQCADIKDDAAYTSLVPVTLGNIPQYVVMTANFVAGIHSKTGKLVWKAPCESKTAVASSPVISKDGAVFVSCGYGVGAHGFQLSAAGGGFQAKETYADKALQNHHGGAVLVGDHVYAAFDNGLKCVDIKTGKVAWQGGPGKGSITYADGHLYCRAERNGTMTLVEASPEAYKEVGKFDPPGQSTAGNCWAYPVVFGGKLYIRDGDTLLCYDVKAK